MKKPAKASGKKKNVERRGAKQKFLHPWLMTSLKGHTGQISDMDFSPNGKYLATCAEGMMTFALFSIIDDACATRPLTHIAGLCRCAVFFRESVPGSAFQVSYPNTAPYMSSQHTCKNSPPSLLLIPFYNFFKPLKDT